MNGTFYKSEKSRDALNAIGKTEKRDKKEPGGNLQVLALENGFRGRLMKAKKTKKGGVVGSGSDEKT